MRHTAEDSVDSAALLDNALEPFLALAARVSAKALQRISSTQLQTLLVVEQHQPITVGRLAAELDTFPSSITRLLQRLEMADLVHRRTGHDRRVVVVELTPDGTALLRTLRQSRRDALRDALAGLSPTSQRRLISSLRNVGSQLGARRPSAGTDDHPSSLRHQQRAR